MLGLGNVIVALGAAVFGFRWIVVHWHLPWLKIVATAALVPASLWAISRAADGSKALGCLGFVVIAVVALTWIPIDPFDYPRELAQNGDFEAAIAELDEIRRDPERRAEAARLATDWALRWAVDAASRGSSEEVTRALSRADDAAMSPSQRMASERALLTWASGTRGWTTANSNVRVAPRSDAQVLRTLPAGTAIRVGQVVEGWRPVLRLQEHPLRTDSVGFIHASLVSNTAIPTPRPAARSLPATVRTTPSTRTRVFSGADQVFVDAYLPGLERKCTEPRSRILDVAASLSARWTASGQPRTPGEALRLLDVAIPDGVRLSCVDAAATMLALSGG